MGVLPYLTYTLYLPGALLLMSEVTREVVTTPKRLSAEYCKVGGRGRHVVMTPTPTPTGQAGSAGTQPKPSPTRATHLQPRSVEVHVVCHLAAGVIFLESIDHHVELAGVDRHHLPIVVPDGNSGVQGTAS
jgi:hypothetical protein